MTESNISNSEILILREIILTIDVAKYKTNKLYLQTAALQSETHSQKTPEKKAQGAQNKKLKKKLLKSHNNSQIFPFGGLVQKSTKHSQKPKPERK